MGGRNLVDPCHGKDRYATLELAERLASRIGHHFGIPLKAYACSACLAFHLAKAMTRERRDRRNERKRRTGT